MDLLSGNSTIFLGFLNLASQFPFPTLEFVKLVYTIKLPCDLYPIKILTGTQYPLTITFHCNSLFSSISISSDMLGDSFIGDAGH